MGEEPALDIGDDAGRDFMAMAKAAMAKAGGGPGKKIFTTTTDDDGDDTDGDDDDEIIIETGLKWPRNNPQMGPK